MQAVEKKSTQEIIVGKMSFEMTDAMNCFQVREKLDELINGDSGLEEIHIAIKRILFEHLENCVSCCRSFDVRVRFRSTKRDRIY